MNPRYEHDCDSCVYLGQFEQYDLYYCHHEPTIVCRFSSEGPDYYSGLTFAVTSKREKYKVVLIRALRKSPEIKAQVIEYFEKYEREIPQRYDRFLQLLKIAESTEEV